MDNEGFSVTKRNKGYISFGDIYVYEVVLQIAALGKESIQQPLIGQFLLVQNL